ncbi:MAG: DUF3990 domain-containing protein [Clostridiales Family XIII bacterium]|jgi:hypothetical protein|nr:DUF3990 domain-containing protein [Clostridiales Family XIII bacterium]
MMAPNVILFHGSSVIVEKPLLTKGKPNNDYGRGFYCTENVELAREWACRTMLGGFVNTYELSTKGLAILKLEAPDHGILEWLALLVSHRSFSPRGEFAVNAKAYLTENFLPDTAPYDIIKGYRADDSYFSFAADFLSNAISLSKLQKAMRLGKLGEQIALISNAAFNNLTFRGAEVADGAIYYAKRHERDEQARNAYFNERQNTPAILGDIYMIDIMRGEMKKDDARLR